MARWWSVVDVQHTHDDAFGPQVPAKQIGCADDGHRRRLSSCAVQTNWLHDLERTQVMQRHRQPLRGRSGRAWRDGGAWWTCSTRTMMLSVRRCQPSRSVAPMAIAGGSHRGRCTRTACMTLAVCKRCSGIDSRSEGVVDVLAAMLERDERAAHASQAGRLGTECVTLGVCERCSGIDSRSESVVDVLGAMVERGERAAHAR